MSSSNSASHRSRRYSIERVSSEDSSLSSSPITQQYQQSKLSSSSELEASQFSVRRSQGLLEPGSTIMCPGKQQEWADLNILNVQPSIKLLPKPSISKHQEEPRHYLLKRETGNQQNEGYCIKRINYKQMLERELQTTKKLQEQISRKDTKIINFQALVRKLKDENKLLSKMLSKQRQKTQTNKTVLTNIDKQISSIKKNVSINERKKTIAEKSFDFSRKEKVRLQEENQEYKVFVESMCESMGLLTGHRIHSMTELWQEWTKIFKQMNAQQNKGIKRKL